MNPQSIFERVAPLVLQFVRDNQTFYSAQLFHFVEQRLGFSANETATRVLRKLRERGFIHYQVSKGFLFTRLDGPPSDLQLPLDFFEEGISI